MSNDDNETTDIKVTVDLTDSWQATLPLT